MKRLLPLALIALGLSACGGGGGGGSAGNPQPVANQSPGGIWKSQYVVTSGPNTGDTIDAIALVSETGQFYAASVNLNNNCAGVSFGQGSVTGSTLTATENAAVVTYSLSPAINTNCVYPDGTTSATGNLAGTVSQRSSLALTFTGTTSGGTALPTQSVTMSFDSLYLEAPSYAKLSGSYATANGSLQISAAGVISEVDPATGCSLSGQATIENASYNLYSVSVQFSGCSVAYAALDGLTLSGLASLDDTVNPNQLILGVSGTASGRYVVIASALNKQ